MFKMSCEFHNDVDVVWENLKCVQACVDLLHKEYSAQIKEKPGLPVFIKLMDVEKRIEQAVSSMKRLRWEEEKRMFGPLAGRKDMF